MSLTLRTSRGLEAPAGPPCTTRTVTAVRGGRCNVTADQLAAEEPLEIHVAGPGQAPLEVGVTMRTPGNDAELAAGLVLTDGIARAAEITGTCAEIDEQTGALRCNVITVALDRPADPARLSRRATATAACGLCGKATLEDLAVRCEPMPSGLVVDAAVLARLPDRLRHAQEVFDRTGGLHAAGLFDLTGELLVLREDIGRHNALDKVIGRGVLDGSLPVCSASGDGGPPGDTAGDRMVMVSGRLGFELVQKVAVAGYPIIAAVSAPSSLAVEAAERLGVTVVGFLRGDRFNVYSHPGRVCLPG